MTGEASALSFRRLLIVILIGATGFGLWRMGSGADDPFARAQEKLDARMDQYVALRMEDDQESIYRLTDPEQRKIKSLRDWLTFYGTGILTPIAFEVASTKIDTESELATVMLESTVRLNRDRLPEPFNTLQEDHEEHLRKTQTDELTWVWREGDWYLRMQREFVTGRSADGRALQGLDPKSLPQR